MKYSIDKIIDDICILENIDTLEIIEVKKEILPNNVSEKMIVEFIDDMYKIDSITYENRKKTISDKLERLKKLKK